jgi:hypothetical protein
LDGIIILEYFAWPVRISGRPEGLHRVFKIMLENWQILDYTVKVILNSIF